MVRQINGGMKLAFLFGAYSVGHRPLDFNHIWDSPRGLSGSDLGIIRVAQECVKLGHDVSFFSCYDGPQPKVWEGIKLFNFDERYAIIKPDWDAIVSWSEFDALKGAPTGPLRVCCDQLNGFTYCAPDWNDAVDICTSPSNAHLQRHLPEIPDPSKWKILPLGADLEVYKGPKVPGRVIWASSADRGLHYLLQEWPKIKAAVPAAHLRIFYNFAYGVTETFEKGDIYCGRPVHDDILEMANRIRYMKEMIQRLKPFGVEHVGSVSREVINKEMSEAMVLAYPCSTLAWSEGFSVTTLEACAAQACPIISDIDALGDIYKDVVPMIKSPVGPRMGEFSDLVIKGLTNEEWRNSVNKKCLEFASRHTWRHTAETLLRILGAPETVTPVINTPAKTVLAPKEFNKETSNSVKLNIASGPNVFPGWINYDRADIADYLLYLKFVATTSGMPDEQKKLTSYIKDGGKIDFQIHDLNTGFPQHQDNSVDLIYGGQMIEHLNPIYQIPKFLKECYRMLKPGGMLRLTTPDLSLLLDAYKNNKMDQFADQQPDFYRNADPSSQLAFIAFAACGPNSTYSNYEGHMFLFTQESMNRYLTEAGFQGPFDYFYEAGQSKHPSFSKECIDAGMNHSFAVECIK